MEYKKIVIFGLTAQGLALLRAYSKADYNVIAFGLKDHVGIYSKYGDIHVIDSLDDIEQLISDKLSGDELIHITSDVILNYMVDYLSDLFEKYEIYPKYKDALIFRDKNKTVELARKLNILCPATFRKKNLKLDNNIKYPLIAKWNRTLGKTPFKTIIIDNSKGLEEFGKTPFKTIIVDNFKGLEEYRSLLESDNIILQQYIPGNSESDISYAGYWLKGVEQIGIVVNQKRQYPAGLSSKVVEIRDTSVVVVREYAKKLLKQTEFNGFVEVECRIDKNSGEVYLIEVNPRACGWIKILMESFSKNVLNNRTKTKLNNKNPKKWINVVRDLRAVLYLLTYSTEQIHFKEILQDYAGDSVKDIFELSDLKPFIMQFKKIINIQ